MRVDLTKSLASGEMVVPTITCYSDIPITSLSFHARKYGLFGLSFHRDFLIRYGARPVMYVPMRADDFHSAHGHALLKHIQAIYTAFKSKLVDPILKRERTRTFGREPETTDGAIDGVNTVLTFHLLAYLKPYNSELDVNHVDYYYSEREWRLTNYLMFQPTDVARIVVSPEYAERLAAEMPEYEGKIFALKF